MGICGPTHDRRSWTFDLDPGGRRPGAAASRASRTPTSGATPTTPAASPCPAIVDVADRRRGHQRLPADHPRPRDASGASSTATAPPTSTPTPSRDEIEEVSEPIYTEVNNGVYRCGFAGTQEAYDEAYDRLFDAPRPARGAADRPALPRRRPHHRGRRAALHHAGALRRGLPRPLQVQPQQAHRDAGAVGLRARPVPDARASATRSTSTTSSGTTTSCTPTSTRRASCRSGPPLENWATPHGREALGGSPFGDGTPPGPPREVVPPEHNPVLALLAG